MNRSDDGTPLAESAFSPLRSLRLERSGREKPDRTQAAVVGWKPQPPAGTSLSGYADVVLPRRGPPETHPQTINDALNSLGRETSRFSLCRNILPIRMVPPPEVSRKCP